MILRLLLTCLVLMLTGLPGCSTRIGYHGERSVAASYRLRTLHAPLPDAIRVESLVAASVDALESRGYSVTSRSVTSESGRVRAAMPEPGLLESVEVGMRATGYGSSIAITIHPLGDETQSRVILDAILHRLSL